MHASSRNATSLNPVRHNAANADPAMLRLARWVFRPLSRLFLRRGLNYHELKSILAWSLVDAAMHDPEFAIEGRRVFRHSISHAAALTGMTRREAGQFADMAEPDVTAISERTRRVMRVLSAWQNDAAYQDAAGKPLVLPMRGPAPSFEALADQERRDVPLRVIADLLVAQGHAEWERRSLRLVEPAAVPGNGGSKTVLELGSITAQFLHSLDRACDETQLLKPRLRRSRAITVPAGALDELRDELHARIEKFHAEIEHLLERYHEADGAGGDGVAVGIGSYSFFDAASARQD